MRADFEAFLDGFSPNVQVILNNFEFRNQIPKLSKADVLGTLIEKFLDSSINLGPKAVLNGDGSVKHPGLDDHAMGTIFEELVRRFNEANNEEAGEHWTPRDAVKLMAKLIFVPIADQIQSGTYLLYDGACEKVWALRFIDRVSVLVLSVVEHNKETIRCQIAMLKMVAAMSSVLNTKQRGQLAEALRDAADQVERPILETITT